MGDDAEGGRYAIPSPRVLLVDDDVGLRASLARELRDLGCVVEVAADGREGRQRWDDAPCELVLTDWKMPRVDGVTFLTGLLDAGAGRAARLALMTGSDPSAAALDGLRGRGVVVLAKPLDRRQLETLLAPLALDLSSEG